MIEDRIIQALKGELTFTLVLSKEFGTKMGFGKGDFLKCVNDGNKLIVQKAEP